MARVEITDEKSAKAWLEQQQRQIRIWFAARCALRAVPGLGSEQTGAFDRVAIVSFRAMIIPAATASCAVSEIGQLEEANYLADSAAAAAADSAAFSARSATFSAAYSARSAAAAESASFSARSAAFAAAHSAYAAYTAADSADSAISAAFSTAAADAGAPGTWPPLWQDKKMPDGLAKFWAGMRTTMQVTPEKWAFWLEWYEAILEGNPLPWGLSLQIAKFVTAEEWEAGPEAVAARIAEIRVRFDLESRINELEQARDETQTNASRLGIGGNNPPEPLDDAAGVYQEATIIWASIEDLKAEVGARTPDRDRLASIISTLSRGLVAILKWCAVKGDLTVDTLIKWGVPAGAAALLAKPDMLKAVIETASKWIDLL